MITTFALDISALALDMTNLATYIDSGNEKASIAQRGKAKQKRTDLRLVGLGLVVTRDGGVPLVSHAYPGNKPDVTQFPAMIDLLSSRHAALAVRAGRAAPTQMTVVFDAGQNSVSNFAYVTDTGLAFVGSIRPSYGTERRVILTHSPTLHDKQAVGFLQTLTKAQSLLTELAEALARGKTRRPTDKVVEEIRGITHDWWVRRVLTWELTGTTPATHRLTFTVNDDARSTLETEVFGKRILVTDQDHWPVSDVVAAYRSQSDAEFSFRQLKDPHVVSFPPMHHFTEHNIRVHTFTCVLALQIAYLIRRHAEQAGPHLSGRELLDQL